jgi:hypothetical protein
VSEDPGVLGNLPRSRPGRRSDKRAGGEAWSEAAGSAGAAGGAAKPAARKSAAAGGARRKPASTGARAGSRTPPRQRKAPVAPEPSGAADPVSGAIRAAGQLAEAGVKTAAKVAGGVIRRLPRP